MKLWRSVFISAATLVVIFGANAASAVASGPWACSVGDSAANCSSASIVPMPTARRELSAATGADGLIYVFGGQTAGGGQKNSGGNKLVEAYDPTNNIWTCSVGDPAPLDAAHCSTKTIAPMPTARLETASALGSDGRIYVFGGINGTTSYNRVEAYDPTTNTWACSVGDSACPTSDRTLAHMPSGRDDMAAAAAPDGTIYVVGGENSSGTKLNTFALYTPNSTGGTWTALPSMPTARDDLAAAVATDGHLYAVGGNIGNSTVATLEGYDPVAGSWSTLASLSSPRDDLAAVSGSCDKVFAIGGDNNDSLSNTTEEYSGTSNVWSLLAPAIPTERDDLAGATTSNGLFYTFGGDNPTVLNTVEAYTIPHLCSTVAHIAHFTALRHGSHIRFQWSVANAKGVVGFNVYAGSHVLNHHLIGVQSSRHLGTSASHRLYRFVARWAGSGRFALHVVLSSGQQAVAYAK